MSTFIGVQHHYFIRNGQDDVPLTVIFDFAYPIS